MEILKANEGMWLTNGETFSKEVFIGRTGNTEDWHEITKEEKQQIEENDKKIEDNIETLEALGLNVDEFKE